MRLRVLLVAGVVWPLLHLLVFFVRFRSLPPLLELAYFVPTGLLGAAAVLLLAARARSTAQRGATALGALLMTPVALFGNLAGGLFGLVGVTVYGVVPLTVGAVTGWLIGKRMRPGR